MPSATRSCDGKSRDVPAAETYAARARQQRAGDGAQRRRLAGAVGADQRDDLAFADMEADVATGRDRAIGKLKTFGAQQRAHGQAPRYAAITAGLRLHLGRSALEQILPVVHDQHAIGDLHHQIHVVLDHDDGHAARAQEANALEQPLDLRRVKPGGGLVDHEQARRGRQRAGEFEHALLAVGRARPPASDARASRPTKPAAATPRRDNAS